MRASILQSFDARADRERNFEQEVLEIKAAQKKYYDAELLKAEKRIYDEVYQKLDAEFNEKLKAQEIELAQKHTKNLQEVLATFEETYKQYAGNFTKIIQFFINHHVFILNKHIMKQEFIDQINQAFLNAHHQKCAIYLNNYTFKQMQNELEFVPFNADIHTDESYVDGDIKVQFDGGGLYFSITQIMQTLSEICSEVSGIDFEEF